MDALLTHRVVGALVAVFAAITRLAPVVCALLFVVVAQRFRVEWPHLPEIPLADDFRCDPIFFALGIIVWIKRSHRCPAGGRVNAVHLYSTIRPFRQLGWEAAEWTVFQSDVVARFFVCAHIWRQCSTAHFPCNIFFGKTFGKTLDGLTALEDDCTDMGKQIVLAARIKRMKRGDTFLVAAEKDRQAALKIAKTLHQAGVIDFRLHTRAAADSKPGFTITAI